MEVLIFLPLLLLLPLISLLSVPSPYGTREGYLAELDELIEKAEAEGDEWERDLLLTYRKNAISTWRHQDRMLGLSSRKYPDRPRSREQ